MGGVELDDEEWNQIIDEVDVNKDGKVNTTHTVFLNNLHVLDL